MAQEKGIWGAKQEAVKEELIKVSGSSIIPKINEVSFMVEPQPVKPIVKTNKNRNTIVFIGLVVITLFLVKKYLK